MCIRDRSLSTPNDTTVVTTISQVNSSLVTVTCSSRKLFQFTVMDLMSSPPNSSNQSTKPLPVSPLPPAPIANQTITEAEALLNQGSLLKIIVCGIAIILFLLTQVLTLVVDAKN